MKFTNYCVIVLGKIEGVKDEIKGIAESKVNFLETKGLVIATFSSIVTASELNDYFMLNNRNFILFEMNPGTYGAFIQDPKINNQLFEEIKKNNPDVLADMGNRLLNEIIDTSKNKKTVAHTGQSTTDAIIIKDESKINIKEVSIEEYVKSLSKNEKIDLINTLMDKGLENLTEKDKEYLDYLSKK